ncbi:MAG: T9SS type A sorting domain-containing protein [Chitinophagales bacterium]|nr:T9SS type A sorting domain-containing protein [Chitinophagales bacterium]
MKKLIYLLCLLVCVKFSAAQSYTVHGAQVQPAWVFPLWFEDGSGAKDTVYFCYDPTANDQYPNTDTLLGEKLIQKDSTKFWVGVWAFNGKDSTIQSSVSKVPFAQLFINNGYYPLKIFWDDTLFYSSALPFPDLTPLPRARISIICSDAFGNCPADIELSMSAIPSTFPFPLVDSAIFNGFENYYVGNTLGEFSLELRPFDSPLEDAIINIQSKSISIYPNPSSDEFIIQLKQQADLRITDVTGRTVKEIFNANGMVVFGKNFNAGIYFVRLKVGNETFLSKIIKQ